jgi:hypothetical protein
MWGYAHAHRVLKVSTSLLTDVSWACGPLLQVTLLVLMLQRGLRKSFPRFFAYIVFQLGKGAVLFLVYRYVRSEYFDAYWAGNAISVFLGVLVIDEIWRNLFAPFRAIQSLGTVVFRWACVVLLVTAVLMAISSAATNADRVVAAVFTFDRTMRLMQLGLAVLLVFFVRLLKSFCRQQVFGIALGFGLFAAIELVLVSIISSYGVKQIATISLIKSVAYNAVTALWIAYVWHGIPNPHPVTGMHQVSEWDLAAVGLAQPQDYPFLQAVEDAVERVMARNAWQNKTTARPKQL